MISVDYIKKNFEKTVPCVLHNEDDKASGAKLCKIAIEMGLKKICVKKDLYDFTFNCLDRKSTETCVYLKEKNIKNLQKSILSFKDYNIKNIFVELERERINLENLDEIFGDLADIFDLSKIVFCISGDNFKIVEEIAEFLKALKKYKIKKVNIIEKTHKIEICAYDYFMSAFINDLNFVFYFTPNEYDAGELVIRIGEGRKVLPSQKFYLCYPLNMVVNRNLKIV